MAELLSPGVFIEELPSAAQTISGVSTSNMGIVGFTPKGPVDRAVLVTSYPMFEGIFGGLTTKSRMGHSMSAYFGNGGRRAYVVRVTPANAVAADAKIQAQTTDQLIETGDGVVLAFSKDTTVVPTTIKVHGGLSPVVVGSLEIRWRASAGAAGPAEQAKQRDGTTNLAADGVLTKFEGRVNPTSLAGLVDANGLPVDPQLDLLHGDFIIASGAQTITIPAANVGPIVTATSGGHTAILDRRTGFFSVVYGVAPAAGAVNVTFQKTTATLTATFTGAGPVLTVGGANIDGAYATVVNGVAANTFNTNTGAYNFKTTAGALPHAQARLLATYKINAWDLNPISAGLWGNDLRVSVRGDDDFFTALTASYSRFTVNVEVKNSVTGLYEVQESFEEVDFTTPTSAKYLPDVVNDLSDLVTVTDPGSDELVEQLNGLPYTQVIAGGDETSANRTITGRLKRAVVKGRTVVITYTRASDSTVQTITDTGTGALTGAVDGTYATTATVFGTSVAANRIDYTTGSLNFRTADTIKVGTLVQVSYRKTAAESVHTEIFGDATKGYTAGTDGTFDSLNFSKDRFTTAALLQTANRGIYALDRVDDIMQVIIPDFAGDTAVAQDLIAWATSRSLLPKGADRFIILVTPSGQTAQDAVDYVRFTLNTYTKYAAIYWPWVKIRDPLLDNRVVVFPPLAHIAGIYARTDITRNVGKAPGGTVDGQILGITALEIDNGGLGPTQAERDVVYPARINPLVATPGTGRAVWGVRTLSQDSSWRYINAVRLFMFLEQSVFNAVQWVVFENNGPLLWSKIATQLNGFLGNLFAEGYFAGNSPSQAFFVIVDETNNTQAVIDSGQLLVDVGAAPNKPAEFARFRFQQKTLSAA